MMRLSTLIRRSRPRHNYMRSTGSCFFSSTASSSTVHGPPFKKYMLITTGIMFGLPTLIASLFVYNLKTDDDFYEHFNEKYPDLIASINEYVVLDEAMVALADRDDVGEVVAASERLHETVQIVAHLQSGERVCFQTTGAATQKEMEALALQHSSSPETDCVVSIVFDEELENVSSKTTLTTAQAWPPAPRTLWRGPNSKPKSSPAELTKALRRELDALRQEQEHIEASKYTGMDIDQADEAIQQLEERKKQVKQALPRKRFLWIF